MGRANLFAMSEAHFVAVEGIDGSGKSTQASILVDRLAQVLPESAPPVLTKAPGGTSINDKIRDLFLSPPGDAPMAPMAEAFLMLADRAQHVGEVIVPALEAGRWVVTDRFSASTIAYQGYGRQLGAELLGNLCEVASGGVEPHLTVLIDIPIELAESRKASRGNQTRLDAERVEFVQRLIRGFRDLSRGRQDWVVVDGSGPMDEVSDLIFQAVTGHFGIRTGQTAE